MYEILRSVNKDLIKTSKSGITTAYLLRQLFTLNKIVG